MFVAGEAWAPATKDKDPSVLGSCLFVNSNGRAGVGHLFPFLPVPSSLDLFYDFWGEGGGQVFIGI